MVTWISLLVLGTQIERPVLPEHAVARLIPLRCFHESTVLEAALPGDRSRLYTVDAAGFLNAWEVATGRRIYRVEPEKGFGSVRGLAASPDGTLLALAPPERVPPLVRLFLAETGKEFRRVERARAPAFSADASILAAVDGKTIRRWLVASGRELPGLRDEDLRDFVSLAVSPDASKIAAGFVGGLTLWDGVTGKPLGRTPSEAHRPASSLAFSRDGRFLAAGDLWGAHVYETKTGLSAPWGIGALAGQSIRFSQDGERLLALHRGRHVQSWDLERRDQPQLEWRAHGDLDSERLALSGDGEIVLRLRGASLQFLDAHVPERFVGVTSAAFLPDGRALTGESNGRIRIWDVATGRDEETLPVPGLSVREVAADGRLLLLRNDAWAVVWDRSAGKEVFRRKMGDHALAALSPDGARVALYVDRLLSVWDAAAGTTKGGRRDVDARLTALAFSPDGRILAQGEAGGSLALMAVDTGREVLRFAPRSDSPISAVAFSRDGGRLATGDASGAVRVWEEGKEPMLVHARRAPLSALAFSPDGRRLAGAAERGGVFVCSFAAPYVVEASYDWAGAEPAAVSFSRDGRRLLTGGRDGAIFIWALPGNR